MLLRSIFDELLDVPCEPVGQRSGQAEDPVVRVIYDLNMNTNELEGRCAHRVVTKGIRWIMLEEACGN